MDKEYTNSQICALIDEHIHNERDRAILKRRLCVGTGNGGTEITEAEYASLLGVIRQRPQDTATTGYRLTTDLAWEPYARELPDQDDDELTADELLNIILGGEAE